MLTIYNGRDALWQWDSGQRLIVPHGSGCEVHYKNPGEDMALVVNTYELDGQTVADIPNILLQRAGELTAYVYVCMDDACTIDKTVHHILPRPKPADYVYTETEIKTYTALEARLDEIEANGVSDEQVEKAVTQYLEENPIDTGLVRYDGPQELTEEEKAQARANLGIETYQGDYIVTPSATTAYTMQTAQKLMKSNVQVEKIPFFDVTNERGGITVYIGTVGEDNTSAALDSAILGKMVLA